MDFCNVAWSELDAPELRAFFAASTSTPPAARVVRLPRARPQNAVRPAEPGRVIRGPWRETPTQPAPAIRCAPTARPRVRARRALERRIAI